MRDVVIRGDVTSLDGLSFGPGVLGAAAAILDAFVAIDSGRSDSAIVGLARLVAFDSEPEPGVALRGVGFRPIVADGGDAARRATRDAFGHATRPPEFVQRVVLIGDVGEPVVADLFGAHSSLLDIARSASESLDAHLVTAERPTLILARDDVGVAAIVLEPVA